VLIWGAAKTKSVGYLIGDFLQMLLDELLLLLPCSLQFLQQLADLAADYFEQVAVSVYNLALLPH